VFVVKAHSFQQQARLAITLAWVAGCTNIISILTCAHVTSHVSGTTSDLGRAAIQADWPIAGFLLFLLFAFLCGAAISGVATDIGRARRWQSIYVLPMALEAGLLTLFALGIEFRNSSAPETGARLFLLTGLASCAMGLQNATITRISSGVVRTTHVTGVLTDLGLELAHLGLWCLDRFRSKPRRDRHHSPAASGELGSHHPHAMRAALLVSILGSFALGAALGTFIYGRTPRLSMFPPVLFLLWIIYQDVVRPIAEIEPSTLVSDTGLEVDDRLVVYHVRRDPRRQGKIHRMPDMDAWADDLPDLPAARFVILDLMGVTQLDANSTLELRNLLERMKDEGRTLVLAGLSHDQVEQLRHTRVGPLLAPENVCPDLELAIAQAISRMPVSTQARGLPRSSH
jgi:uncharacterized membrane protein YoaK (UPF0700 family)